METLRGEAIVVGFMMARRSGTEGAYAQVAKDMARVAMPSLEKFFASDDAPCKISCSVLHEYLSGKKYANEPYAAAARFWLKVCTQMDVLEATSKICVVHFGRRVSKLPDMDASNVFMKVVKLLPTNLKSRF